MTRMALLGLGAAFLIALRSAAHAEPYAIGVSWDGASSLASRIDLGSGQATLLGPTGFGTLNALALGPSGQLLAAGNSSSLVSIDPLTGQGTAVANLGSNIGPGTSIRGLAFSPAGVLYAINNGDGPNQTGSPDLLYTIDQLTGAATLLGSVGYDGVQALDFAPDDTLYGWDVGGVGLITINALTGAATDVNPAIGDFGAMQAIAFARNGRLYGATNGPQSSLVEINRLTGAVAVAGGPMNLDIRGLAIVPEPLGILSGLIGIALLAGTLRRSATDERPT